MYTNMMTSNFQGSTLGHTKQGRPLPGVRRPGSPLEPGLESWREGRRGVGSGLGGGSGRVRRGPARRSPAPGPWELASLCPGQARG